MSAERKIGFVEKNFRGLLAASMLFIAPDAGPPPANQFGQVKRVEAAGLMQFQEQDVNWEEWDKVVDQVTKPVEAKDLAGVRRLLSTGGYLDWTYNLNRTKVKSVSEMTDLFKKSFETRGAPSCVGYKWEIASIVVLFDNLGVLNNPDSSGHALLYLSVNAQKIPRIEFVSEVPKDRLEIEKRSIGVVDLPPGAKVKLGDETVLRPCGKAKEQPKTPSHNYIALVPGMLTFIDETGIEVNGRFSPLRNRLAEPDFNYHFSDYIMVGYTGGYIDNRGNYIARRQSCEETLQSLDASGQNVAEMIVGWLKAHPNDNLVVVGHSLGGPVILRALEIIMDKNLPADMKRVKIITTHSPNQGINKSPLDILGQILPPGLPGDCYIVAPVIGRTPPPQVLDYPATRELLAMWDQRGETLERWRKVTTWMKSRGGQIVALSNFQDCVIAIEMCASRVVGRWPWDLIMPWYLSWVDDPWFYATLPSVLWSQEIPGATNIWRALGNDPNWGHTMYLDEGEGLEILAAVIGEQNK